MCGRGCDGGAVAGRRRSWGGKNPGPGLTRPPRVKLLRDQLVAGNALGTRASSANRECRRGEQPVSPSVHGKLGLEECFLDEGFQPVTEWRDPFSGWYLH